MAVLTACTSSENPVVVPQEETTQPDQEFAKSVVGVYCDFDVDEKTAETDYYIYDVQEDGKFDIYYYFDDGDPDSELENMVFNATWKPALNIVDRWEGGEPLSGIEVTFDLKALGLEELAENGETVAKDSILILSTENDQMAIWVSDLDDAYAYYNSLTPEQKAELEKGAGTRNFFESLAEGFVAKGRYLKKLANSVTFLGKVLVGKSFERATGMSDWMQSIYNDKNPKICDISIPGTHDTFTYDLKWWNNLPGLKRKVQTQALDIENQWDAGVRCFDVRIGRNSDGHLMVYHGAFQLTTSFHDAVMNIANLVRNHKGETAIVILKFESTPSEKDYAEVWDLTRILREQGLVVDNPSPDLRLDQCRGKLLFIQRYDSNKFNLDVRATGWNENSELIFMNDANNKAPLHVQDLYESNGREMFVTFIKRKISTMEDCFKAAASSTDNTWFFNHSSAYHGMAFAYLIDAYKYAEMNYAQVAEQMNPWEAEYISKNPGKKTGVVVMDFAGVNTLSDGSYYTNGIEAPTSIVNNNKQLKDKLQ